MVVQSASGENIDDMYIPSNIKKLRECGTVVHKRMA